MRSDDIKKNIASTRKAIQSSRYLKSGLTPRATKLSSKNFNRLMQKRGLTKSDAASIKASFQKGTQLVTRHAKKGEPFIVTHGQANASGVFVSKRSLGKTPGKRQNRGALPHSNTAKFETKVVLDRDQNVITGRIAPQSKFQKMDPKGTPRRGGGIQTITDGGYKSNAIRNNDPKFPTVSDKSSSKTESFKNSLSKQTKVNKEKPHIKSQGQKR